MRATTGIVTALMAAAVPVLAGPCRPGKDAFCTANSLVLSALKLDGAATAFCSSYLSISTVTIDETVSVTPAASTDVVSSTLTASTVTSTLVSEELRSSEATVTSTAISYSTTTTTLTTSTVTLSCLDSAYTANAANSASASVAAASSSSVLVSVPKKRTLPPAIGGPPAEIPVDWPQSAVSQICSCLALPTPTYTNTVHVSLSASVDTVTATVTVTPSATVTSSFVSVSTSTYTSVSYTISVVVETAYATATTIATSGAAAYRRYNSPYDANIADGGFTSDYFGPGNPTRPAVLSSGALASLTFSTPSWPGSDTYLYLANGDTFDSAQAALLFQGFFVARQTGTYTLSSSGDYIDNYGYLWTGDVAYSTWDDSNTAFQASRTGAGYYGGSVAVTLNEGDAIPIAWLWANGGGVGQSWFVVSSPDGSSTTDTTGFLVPACSADTFA
ncbi:hypothetical protein SCUCBS95973_009388 [Sporothrix curviconia]|uniref:PA14 domain-containing protein n=1 Tax=Sporothrix curviconia TaxID=1260050 RepID=A0ABP0CUT0_9PEZI